MKEFDFDAHAFLVEGAKTKAGDNAARERVLKADIVAIQRSAGSLRLIRSRAARALLVRRIGIAASSCVVLAALAFVLL